MVTVKSVKVVVDLGSLPQLVDDHSGHEVIANFEVEGFDNNKIFWTDSNGLQMQKRVLNYRPTWDINKNYQEANQNVTANYYPVTSGVLMQEYLSPRNFLVMNDRSQAATALTKGGIQFMINRRISADDWRGMGEWVDEKGPDGDGIRMPATFLLRLFSAGNTHQRTIQNKIDNPAQVFYTPSLSQSSQQKQSSANYTTSLWNAGIRNTVKLTTIPLARNHVLLRLANLQDPVDGDTSNKTVQLDQVVNAMLQWTNPSTYSSLTYNVTEKSLTANMDLTEMLNRRIKWKTVDDDKTAQGSIDYTFNGTTVTLEPQRIRVFELKVTAPAEVKFLAA